MSINSIDITNDREHLIVHLDDEADLFFEIPKDSYLGNIILFIKI